MACKSSMSAMLFRLISQEKLLTLALLHSWCVCCQRSVPIRFLLFEFYSRGSKHNMQARRKHSAAPKL
jgi:hypothetical protein